MTLNVQFLTMITMISGGFYLGIAVDTFRRFDRHWKSKKVWIYLFEISFWLLQTFILYYLLFLVNSGELRLYVFAACLLGYATYRVLAASIYKKILEKFIVLVKGLFNFLVQLFIVIIYKPVKYLVQFIMLLLGFLLTVIWNVLKICFKIIFTPIKWILDMVYRILPNNFKLFLHKIAGFYSKIKNICIKYVKKYISHKRR